MNQILAVLALGLIGYVAYRLIKKLIADNPFDL